ncbi:MAG: RagB/SusD family nutrient uptake outer membrane protein [Bacteroidota bacterium]|nr:RagB/SusD family nutrient uptake outer membrane protein [Bacteroidota bacterium]
MKKLSNDAFYSNKILLITFFALLAVSCKKVLEEAPNDRLATTNFYKTESDANVAINAIYNPIRGQYGSTNWGGQFTGMEDYAYGTGIYANISLYGMNSGDISRTDDSWRSFFRAINSANMALKYIPAIPMADANKNALLAEARFLRAWCYRNLVWSWGAVPIRKEPTESLDQIGGKRAPVAEVYNFIIEDLKYAEENLPSKPALAGKPTKWAAKTMLADIYLFTEKWAEARDKADEVITSSGYSLVPVKQPSDFDLLFGPTAITSSEDIFSIKYARTVGSEIAQQYAQPNSAYSSGGYGSFYGLPTFPLLRDWDKQDLRYQYDIYTSYPNRQGVIVQAPASAPILFGKFKDPGFAPSHGNDFPIYRFADALLIYAEAAGQAANGPTALALERLNMIRRRAYGKDPNTPSTVDYTTADAPTRQAFRDLVLKERAYEFFNEGKRWFDLVRTKTLKTAVKAAKGLDVPDFITLFAIPKSEIDNNPDINPEDQNPGY